MLPPSTTQFKPDDDNLRPGKIIMIYLLTSNVDCQVSCKLCSAESVSIWCIKCIPQYHLSLENESRSKQEQSPGLLKTQLSPEYIRVRTRPSTLPLSSFCHSDLNNSKSVVIVFSKVKTCTLQSELLLMEM